MSKVVIGGQEIDKDQVASAKTRNTSVQITMKDGSEQSINVHTEIAAQKAVEALSSESSSEASQETASSEESSSSESSESSSEGSSEESSSEGSDESSSETEEQ